MFLERKVVIIRLDLIIERRKSLTREHMNMLIILYQCSTPV